MPSSISSDRYSPLQEPDEVRIDMEELPRTQQITESQWQDSARKAPAATSGAASPPPVGLEMKPPPERGMSCPMFNVKKSLNLRDKEDGESQQESVVSLPDLRAAFEEVSDCIHGLGIILTSVQSMKRNHGTKSGLLQIQLRWRHFQRFVHNVFSLSPPLTKPM